MWENHLLTCKWRTGYWKYSCGRSNMRVCLWDLVISYCFNCTHSLLSEGYRDGGPWQQQSGGKAKCHVGLCGFCVWMWYLHLAEKNHFPKKTTPVLQTASHRLPVPPRPPWTTELACGWWAKCGVSGPHWDYEGPVFNYHFNDIIITFSVSNVSQ